MHEKVSTDLNFVEREKEVLKYWKQNDIFKESIKLRENGEMFTFYDGPPTANGKPHIGHILTRSIKDIIPRYKTMKGFNVLRKAGWDTHGLPVELEVEKQLGINGKDEIEKFGVEEFIQKCKESVWKYESEWREMSDRVGFWADMDEPYVTYHNNYIESVWWALKIIWDKGLLYKGYKIVPYCPRCGTALSSHEVAQGYKDVKEKSAVAKFKVKNKDNEYLLAWTTTPWTLPSNVALCVNANENYVKAESGGELFIMAEALLETVLPEPYNIVEKFKGVKLEHMEYEPLFGFVETKEKANYVVCDDYVTLTDGTGIVHIAPAFGEDDARIGRKYGLPFVQLVDSAGKMTDEAKPFAGLFVKEADPVILQYMSEKQTLYKAMDYEHNYPFCWRCDTPLIYYARNGWFIEMSKLRGNLLRNNDTVNWMPDNIKTGRFGNFLENVIDWALSRERYWGTPLPLWECDCGHRHAIGSIAELKAMSDDVPDDIELHKPFIDKVFLNCPKCGGKMKRTPEVIDCWFDAGSMPFAQWHYPFENKDKFDKNFPSDFISEAIDQTRGWFYTLMAISTALFDIAPYKNVVVMGLVQDKNGHKMSKHLGNGVDPWDILNKQGADAVRWYFYSSSAPWLPNRFHEEMLNEGQRKFMGTFWNTYAFYVLYAKIDGFDASKYQLENDGLPLIDKWILSKLNNLIKFVTDGLDNYKITETSRAVNDFTDELSNWYVRRSRERFWGNGIYKDKIDAYMTLYTVLTEMAKLIAPFTPFMAEAVYNNLVLAINPDSPKSVHLCDYPVADEKLINAELETDMDLVLSIVTLGRAARSAANLKTRQPAAKLLVQAAKEPDDMFKAIVSEELNVKSVEFINDASRFSTYTFKPQLKTVGPKYGKLLGKISAYLQKVDGNDFMEQLKSGGANFEIDGSNVELTLDDVLFETAQTEGYSSASDRGVTVVIETTLTPELIEEGFVREIISKLQTMRKEAGFEVLDKINVYYEADDVINGVFERNANEIKRETLAEVVAANLSGGYKKEWNINGENAVLCVERITC